VEGEPLHIPRSTCSNTTPRSILTSLKTAKSRSHWLFQSRTPYLEAFCPSNRELTPCTCLACHLLSLKQIPANHQDLLAEPTSPCLAIRIPGETRHACNGRSRQLPARCHKPPPWQQALCPSVRHQNQGVRLATAASKHSSAAASPCACRFRPPPLPLLSL